MDRETHMQVFTSDHALKLEWIPDWVAIIGSGYIGLEFSDVYTALGSEVTFIEVQTLSSEYRRKDNGCSALLHALYYCCCFSFKDL